MSMSMLRSLVSKIPKCSLKGIAYISAANFLARAVILIRHYIINYFHSEMVLIYGASLDTRILLFFQSIYMIPMFALGVLVFYGIDRESFNLVLYPTLMLLFLILIRYGSEAALLVTHWEDHKFDQTPELAFSLLQDVIFLSLLFVYVYFCLAFTPIKPTPVDHVERGGGMMMPSTSQNHAYSQDSQGFNYALRRNVTQIPKEFSSDTTAMLGDTEQQQQEQQKQRNSLLVVKEKDMGGPAAYPTAVVIETNLDAVLAPAAVTPAAAVTPVAPAVEPTIIPKQPSPVPAAVEVVAAPPVALPEVKEEEEVKVEVPEPAAAPAPNPAPAPAPPLTKSRVREARKLAAAKSLSTESAPKEPEKASEGAETDFWSTMNGEGNSTTTKKDGFKTTSV